MPQATPTRLRIADNPPSSSLGVPQIERFCKEHEMPIELGICLIGRTVPDTAENMDRMKEFISHVIRRFKERQAGIV
mgnify:CR=1 FL=1